MKFRIAVAALFSAVIAPTLSFAAETAPAKYAGVYQSCKDLGGFSSIGTDECFSCPSAKPDRTIYPARSDRACKKGASRKYSRATQRGKPTGKVLKTNCPGNQFLVATKGRCYSCPSGYKRTLRPIGHAKACSRKTPTSFASAVSLGPKGCPEGSFRHLLTDRCYACPAGSTRNLRLGDPAKIDACTFRNTTRIKDRFNADKNKDSGTRSRALTMIKGFKADRANVIEGDPGGQEDKPGKGFLEEWLNEYRYESMKRTLFDEAENDSDYTTIVWVIEGGGAVVLGYTHGEGFAMHLDEDGDYSCREVTINTFQAGAIAGAGLEEAFSLERGDLDDVEGQSNGFAIGVTALTGVSWGLDWDSDTGARAVAFGIGAGKFEVEGGYNHSWTSTGDDIACSQMNWYED